MNMRTFQFPAVIVIGLFLSACGGSDAANQQRNGNTDSTSTSAPAPQEVTYACPMHPEVTGMKGDTCPKCGMDLEVVEQTK